ncbi:MAG: acyl carrier protein [Candidatus Omnitrophica bacterium]|nr:acyl carrier protein [Candidatus Omnitrophota bacterium]
MNKEKELEIIAIIAKIAKKEIEEIKPPMKLTQIGIDSFSSLEIVFAIENKFKVSFPSEGLSLVSTVGELIEHVRALTDN